MECPCFCEVRDELHLLHDGLNMGPKDSNDLRKMSLILLVLRKKNVSPLLHHSACLDGHAESESPEVLCRRHCVR